ncbi:cob(I)yrinic acid a,c-diamide adenosyltransferase [Nitrospina watsonii]|uniref:corrinoid adenosyltransferase n=1 Tax=Nitrospina watsonii TaxID=1323948 RepID=A0ABM9HH43_9BACT|nr:cob(I)yrinic acid a,c-diamide adenosyltransferase [Nitrospina watsonii]CAI2719344.1 Corrinoid adenosyltransferase [Nitrospina watsonii]
MKKRPASDPKKRKGLVIVHTGDGKGKSTAAYGLALRAAGNKMKVFILQFMKGQWKTGERKMFTQLEPWIEYVAMGDGFTWDTNNPEQDRRTASQAWETVKPKILDGDHSVVILDEINYVLSYQFLDVDEVLDTLRRKPASVHVICTGRNAPDSLIELADMVTEMKCVKHPFKEQRIPAQKGIEF